MLKKESKVVEFPNLINLEKIKRVRHGQICFVIFFWLIATQLINFLGYEFSSDHKLIDRNSQNPCPEPDLFGFIIACTNVSSQLMSNNNDLCVFSATCYSNQHHLNRYENGFHSAKTKDEFLTAYNFKLAACFKQQILLPAFTKFTFAVQDGIMTGQLETAKKGFAIHPYLLTNAFNAEQKIMETRTIEVVNDEKCDAVWDNNASKTNKIRGN